MIESQKIRTDEAITAVVQFILETIPIEWDREYSMIPCPNVETWDTEGNCRCFYIRPAYAVPDGTIYKRSDRMVAEGLSTKVDSVYYLLIGGHDILVEVGYTAVDKEC